MLKFEKYVVGSGETEGYKALKATIPEDDVYMHYRLDGNCLGSLQNLDVLSPSQKRCF